MVDALGLPQDLIEDDYTGYEHRSGALFIEIQVWRDFAKLGL
jgi:hypothetical protein